MDPDIRDLKFLAILLEKVPEHARPWVRLQIAIVKGKSIKLTEDEVNLITRTTSFKTRIFNLIDEFIE